MKIKDPSQRQLISFFQGLEERKTQNCLDCGKKLDFWSKWFAGRSYFCKECYQKRLDGLKQGLNLYSDKLLKAVRDGKLTASEEAELKGIQKNFGLSELPVKMAATHTYQRLYQEITSDRQVTDKEVKQIEELLSKFEISEKETAPTLKTLSRLRFLTLLEEGILPEIQADMFLKKKEVAHYQAECELLEERTKREYVGGYSGLSIRVAKGVSWRVGGFKGKPIEKTEMSKVDQGSLVVTNKRLVFSGDRKSFSVPYSKLIDIDLFKDAVKLNREGKIRREYFVVPDPEILAKIITMAVNQE